MFDTAGRIDKATARVRQADGSMGDPVETLFNDLNQPTQVKAFARAGSGLPDQITQLQYDGGAALTVGKLTKIIEAFGTAQQQETHLFYDAPDGTWGLPTRVQNELGAESSLDYHDATGLLLSAASPQNLVAPSNHPDRPASTSVIAYNGDNLPSQITDPEGHITTVSYNAAAAGSPNLVITLTSNDTTKRWLTLDAMGRTIEVGVDREPSTEQDLITQYTYTPSGELKTIRQAHGTPDARVTAFHRNLQGDVYAVDPPQAGGTRIWFEYFRYNPDGAPASPAVYEGEVTRILHPGELSEFFGYNNAGELAWKRKRDGTLITLTRDA